MSGTSLTCPFCGSPDIHQLANKVQQTMVITPYHCDGCQRTFESGPFQLPQKASPSDPKPKRDGD
jgi:transcription elongation factor Elf1